MNDQQAYIATTESMRTTWNFKIQAERWRFLAENCQHPVYRSAAQERADLLSVYLKPKCLICGGHHDPQEQEKCDLLRNFFNR